MQCLSTHELFVTACVLADDLVMHVISAFVTVSMEHTTPSPMKTDTSSGLVPKPAP